MSYNMNEYPPQGYPPQQGYPPPNNGYPPQGYPPQSYPPQNNNYPPNQGNWNPPQQNYPPQNPIKIDSEKFKPVPKYRDIWAFFLYCLFVIAFTILSAFMLKGFSLEKRGDTDQGSNGFGSAETFISFAIASAVSFVLSLVYIFLMQIIPTFLIHVSFWFSIALYILATVYYLINKAIFIGIIFAILSVVNVFLYFNWRPRIPFASIMLENVSRFTKKYYGTIVVGILFLVIEIAFIAWWAFTLIAAIDQYSDKNCHDTIDRNGRTVTKCSANGSLYGIYVFMAFVLFWTSQLLKDLVHMTIAGAFASFYFFGNQNNQFTTASALKRSMTTSIGSACFGSLLVSLIRFLRFLIQQLVEQSDNAVLEILGCCLNCILAQFEHLLEYFNLYAYTYCAMYGKPYLAAGKATWTLIKDRGVEAIINDSLVGKVLGMGSLLIGVISALLGYVYIAVANPIFNANSAYTAPIVIICFILALLINTVVFQVIESANVAFFVCLAEDPQALAQINPALFEQIRITYPQITTSV